VSTKATFAFMWLNSKVEEKVPTTGASPTKELPESSSSASDENFFSCKSLKFADAHKT